MSYNQQDAHNLNVCKTLFGTDTDTVGGAGELLYHVPLKRFVYDADAATILADGLMSATRYDQDVYCWLDVQTSHLPEIVPAALEQCAGFGLRLVITHNDKCSHGPGKRFPLPLMKLLAAASTSADTWHPILEKMVPSMKNWVRAVADLPQNHPLFTDPRAVAGYYHAVAEVLAFQGPGFTVDGLLVRMGGAEIARIAADQEDLLAFAQNGVL
jgi:hypothetical protein